MSISRMFLLIIIRYDALFFYFSCFDFITAILSLPYCHV